MDGINHAVTPVADAIIHARKNQLPVILFSGAHLLKNGLGPLIIEWMRRSVLTLYAVNTAGTIHDFELALIGETSEYVPNALGRGEFGMAYEFAFINEAIREGNQRRLGYGESLSRMITDVEFRTAVMSRVQTHESPKTFAHPECSVLAASAVTGVPVTVHAIIGGDVIDQHPSFDGEAKGGTSGRDFLIFVEHVRRLRHGGVFINMGSAVIGPEVFLKAVSMVCNVGDSPSSDLVHLRLRWCRFLDGLPRGFQGRDQARFQCRYRGQLLLGRSGPPEDHPDAAPQLIGINRFGQIILGPQIQATDLVARRP